MKSLILLLATGLGSGYSPCCPGTVGSAAAALLVLYFQPPIWLLVILCLAGVYICGQAELLMDRHDSPQIVFDEFCGIMIAAWGLTSGTQIFYAFLAFRFFDIVKPLPINRLQEFPGGWGVMADDIAAGVAARALLMLFNI